MISVSGLLICSPHMFRSRIVHLGFLLWIKVITEITRNTWCGPKFSKFVLEFIRLNVDIVKLATRW